MKRNKLITSIVAPIGIVGLIVPTTITLVSCGAIAPIIVSSASEKDLIWNSETQMISLSPALYTFISGARNDNGDYLYSMTWYINGERVNNTMQQSVPAKVGDQVKVIIQHRLYQAKVIIKTIS